MVFRPDFNKTHFVWRIENQLRGLIQMETKDRKIRLPDGLKAGRQKLDLNQTTNQPYMWIQYKTNIFKVTDVNQSPIGTFLKSLFIVFFFLGERYKGQ